MAEIRPEWAEYIAALVARAPEPTPAQRDRLKAILGPTLSGQTERRSAA